MRSLIYMECSVFKRSEMFHLPTLCSIFTMASPTVEFSCDWIRLTWSVFNSFTEFEWLIDNQFVAIFVGTWLSSVCQFSFSTVYCGAVFLSCWWWPLVPKGCRHILLVVVGWTRSGIFRTPLFLLWLRVVGRWILIVSPYLILNVAALVKS